MAEPPAADDSPRPAKPIKAASSVPFAWLLNHPSFSNSNASASSPSSSPSLAASQQALLPASPQRLHAASSPPRNVIQPAPSFPRAEHPITYPGVPFGFAVVSPDPRATTQSPISTNPQRSPTPSTPRTNTYSIESEPYGRRYYGPGPAIPAIQATPVKTAAKTNRVNRVLAPTPPSHEPPLWHTKYSQYRNTTQGFSQGTEDTSQHHSPNRRQAEFEAVSALQRAQIRRDNEAVNSWDGTDDWIANNRDGHAPVQLISQFPLESEASLALERSQLQAQAEASRSQVDTEPEKRSPTYAIAEVKRFMEDEGLDDISSDDEDFRDFKAGLTKARYNVEIFKATHEDEDVQASVANFSGRTRRTIGGRGGYKGTRGPRLAAEPRGDVKLRLSQASEAFLNADYEEAKAIATEVVRINAETHQAWTMLASCFYELGDRDKALTALTYAAHLEPKNKEGWIHCANVFLEEIGTGVRRSKALQSAFFCYSAALKVDTKDKRARLGKASIYIERNQPAGAISEFKKLHSLEPNDVEIIINLCAAYYDHEEFANARDLYKTTFDRLRADDNTLTDTLGWSDLVSYIALYDRLGEHEIAIKELKSLSRWLLGRGSEIFWDTITQDDREWDSDNSRRLQIPGFDPNSYPSDRYGNSLPLELRARLGTCRLAMGDDEEALHHFDYLRGLDESGIDKVFNYPDLYRQVADKLQDAKRHQDAITFYLPLTDIPDENTGDLHVQVGSCYLNDGNHGKAEASFLAAIGLDKDNIESRVQLAKLYESLDEQEHAFIYINEVLSIKRAQNPVLPRRRRSRKVAVVGTPVTEIEAPNAESEESSQSEDETPIPVNYSTYRRRRLADPDEKVGEETSRFDEVQAHYFVFRNKLEDMRSGDRECTRAWMRAAQELTSELRGVRKFYPYDKYALFLGYKKREDAPAEGDELSAMADRLSQHLGANIPDKTRAAKIEMPLDYQGITISIWLDIFLEYALALARHGKRKHSYELCEAAKDCALFYSNREDVFLIHICWLACSLLLCDEESCVNVARYFMKDYQFTTDSYRMFQAISRMVHSPVNWYSSGPSQKYMLRQIKAMDYAHADEDSRKLYFGERGSYSSVDDKGQTIINEDLNIALLMLYGHILYTGGSYLLALNYFLRAYALDPTNPMINLNVGLAYVHQALRRLTPDRQHLILQGTAFMFNYYNSRKVSPRVEERQEAHYNMARIYHMLGLTHVAVPYYAKVFEEVSDDGDDGEEEMVIEAAYNLQTIYSMSGNHRLAKEITGKWLVI